MVNFKKLMMGVLILSLALSACGDAPTNEAPEATDAPSGNTGNCPAVTVADAMGVAAGRFPQQYELVEFESLAGCDLTFSQNPDIAELNTRITNNPELPPVEERLPSEPLVVAPYVEIGRYGGVLNGLSNATESGTSDLLSVRHANLFRYSDDLQTIVPHVARDWNWNDDYTVLTIELREGHKWSNGQPFTTEDIRFWYEDVILNTEIFPETPTRWLFAGEPMEIEVVDDTTIRMTFPVPNPGIVTRLAVDYGQPFLPKHFFEQYHIAYNSDANALAAEEGYESWADLFNEFYGNSDWKDVPSPLIDGAFDFVMPTLESHIVVEETTEGRHLVANPYFHIVDTAGNQLPYISEIDERYVSDAEVRNLMITNGEVDYKAQAVFIGNYTLYRQNEEGGNYTVDLSTALGEDIFYSFNVNHKDPELREIFSDLRFRQAMSLAINRPEIVEIIYLGQGTPQQSVPVDPNTVTFVTDEHLNAFVDYDPEGANALLDDMGLTDTDNDGIRNRPNGRNLIVLLQFSNQGGPVRLHELVSDYWQAVGVEVQLKEVTSDEYREQANNNDLDLTTWLNDGVSAPVVTQDFTALVPPFGDFFNPGTGFEWATWVKSEGAEGTEPPADVLQLFELTEEFIQYPPGTADSNRVGTEIVDIHVSNLWKIGIVGSLTAPVIHTNNLGNFPPDGFTAKSYDYYWSYAYRPHQWFLDE